MIFGCRHPFAIFFRIAGICQKRISVCLPGVNISMWLQKQAPENFQGGNKNSIVDDCGTPWVKSSFQTISGFFILVLFVFDGFQVFLWTSQPLPQSWQPCNHHLATVVFFLSSLTESRHRPMSTSASEWHEITGVGYRVCVFFYLWPEQRNDKQQIEDKTLHKFFQWITCLSSLVLVHAFFYVAVFFRFSDMHFTLRFQDLIDSKLEKRSRKVALDRCVGLFGWVFSTALVWALREDGHSSVVIFPVCFPDMLRFSVIFTRFNVLMKSWKGDVEFMARLLARRWCFSLMTCDSGLLRISAFKHRLFKLDSDKHRGDCWLAACLPGICLRKSTTELSHQ